MTLTFVHPSLTLHVALGQYHDLDLHSLTLHVALGEDPLQHEVQTVEHDGQQVVVLDHARGQNLGAQQLDADVDYAAGDGGAVARVDQRARDATIMLHKRLRERLL